MSSQNREVSVKILIAKVSGVFGIMIQAMSAALTGLRAYVNNARTAANNIANSNTPGYKRSSTVTESAPAFRGAYTGAVLREQSQGAIVSTGNSFDVAINGSGFFEVRTSDGKTGYTRAGSFRADSQGRLADSSGNILQPEINVPAGAKDFAIERDGSVSTTVNGQKQNLGTIKMVNFNNPGGLSQGGGNVYYETAASGQPSPGIPGTGGLGEIYPNSLELSNVDIGEEMVGLIQSEHGFKAQIKTIQTSDEMLGSLLDIKT